MRFYIIALPPTISDISVVMAACLAWLSSSVRVDIRSSVLSVAAVIAVMRAECSPVFASSRTDYTVWLISSSTSALSTDEASGSKI